MEIPKLPIGGGDDDETSTTERGSRSRRRTDSSGMFEADQARKRIIIEKVSQIIAGLDMTPRIFKGTGEVEPKLWQQAATSVQSPLMLKLKKNLHERKQKMKIFTANKNFEDYFYVAKGPEFRPMPSLVESTMGSKEEVVSREVIHKTAMAQLRCHFNDFHSLTIPE